MSACVSVRADLSAVFILWPQRSWETREEEEEEGSCPAVPSESADGGSTASTSDYGGVTKKCIMHNTQRLCKDFSARQDSPLISVRFT